MLFDKHLKTKFLVCSLLGAALLLCANCSAPLGAGSVYQDSLQRAINSHANPDANSNINSLDSTEK